MIELQDFIGRDGTPFKKYVYTRDERSENVGIIYGHFSPFTGPNGHGRMIQRLQEAGCTKFLIAIPESKQKFDTDRNMFSVSQRLAICQKYLDDEGLYGKAISIKTTKPEYQIGRLGKQAGMTFGNNINIIFCFGPDRANMIGLCDTLGGPEVHRYEAIVMSDRGEKAISGTKMRKYILDGDKEAFEKDTGYKSETVNMIFDMFEQNLEKYQENISYIGGKMKRIREGGNLTVEGKEGSKSATKLQVAMMEPEEFKRLQHDFIILLKKLSHKFADKYGRLIWEDESILDRGLCFSGSTRTFFQKDWKTYSTYKKKVGDFDLQLPEEVQDQFNEWFPNEIEGTSIGSFEFYGWQQSYGQSHTLLRCFDYPGVGADFLQLDFEFVPYEGTKPSPFATFAHYSSWEDLEGNIKGVFMKYLMRALVDCLDFRNNVTLVTPKGRAQNTKESRAEYKRFSSFSVDAGVSTRYKPYIDPETGKQAIVNGHPAWTYAKVTERNTTQNLNEIFETVFHHPPKSEQDIKDMHSYIRMLKLMRRELPLDKVEKVYDTMIEFMWAPDGQKLSAFDKDEDKEWKVSANDKFIEIFPELSSKQDKINEMIETYYSNYTNRERNLSREERAELGR